MDKFGWGALHFGGLIVLVILAGAFFVWGGRRREAILKSLVDLPLLPQLLPAGPENRRNFKTGLILLCLFFGVLALMDPLYDYTWVTEKRKGVDLLVALDVSKSMYAKDITPSRFERSKLEILNLAAHLQGDRVGLIVFTSIARPQCPLTLDYEAFRLIASEMEIGVLSQGGTDLSVALEQALESFDKQYKKERILILVTDGESLEGSWEKFVEPLKQANIRVFTVGLGSKSGAPILLPSENGQTEYVKDRNGNIVLSKLDEDSLKKLALMTGGAYVQTETAGFNLEKLYTEKIAPLEGRDLESKRQKRYEHRFYIPLAFALFCLLLEILLQEIPVPRKKTLALLGLLFFGMTARPVRAADVLQEAEKAYHAGDYQKAELAYQEAGLSHPDSPELSFNQGTVLYKENKFENAAALFEKALYSTDPDVEAKAYYNLGNTYYRLGKLEQSVESFKKSLKLNPKQIDCQQNLEFVQGKIKELLDKKGKQQEPQENPKSQKGEQGQESSGGEAPEAEKLEQAKASEKQELKDPEKEKLENGSPGDTHEQKDPPKEEADLVKKDPDPKTDEKEASKDEKGDKALPPDEKQKDPSRGSSQDGKDGKNVQDDKGDLSTEDVKNLDKQVQREDGDPSAQDEERDVPGRLTKEEAERILKSLEDRERQNRKQNGTVSEQRESASGRGYYKDW